MSILPVNDIIEWDIPNWSQLIKYWTPVIEKLPRDSKVLAIGERNGGLTIWLAMMGFNVVCTDREGPTEKARQLHIKYGVSDRVTYGDIDIVNCTPDSGTYDLIIAKSVIGGLKSDPKDRMTRNFEVQKKAVANIYAMLKPGGIFLSAENTKGSILVSLVRKIKGKDRGWRYFNWSEIKELYAVFPKVEIKTFGIIPTLFPNGGLNKFIFLVNKYIFGFLPNSSKYISFTAAQK